MRGKKGLTGEKQVESEVEKNLPFSLVGSGPNESKTTEIQNTNMLK